MSVNSKKRDLASEKLASGSLIDRRALVHGGALLAGGTVAAALLPPFSTRESASAAALPAMNGDPIVASDKKAVVETSAGKIRGYTRNGIYTFKGIPFGASTEGDARFMPPQSPHPGLVCGVPCSTSMWRRRVRAPVGPTTKKLGCSLGTMESKARIVCV
jgi:hypothetical protein